MKFKATKSKVSHGANISAVRVSGGFHPAAKTTDRDQPVPLETGCASSGRGAKLRMYYQAAGHPLLGSTVQQGRLNRWRESNGGCNLQGTSLPWGGSVTSPLPRCRRRKFRWAGIIRWRIHLDEKNRIIVGGGA